MAFLYYLSNRLYRWHIPILPRLCMLLIRLVWGSFIPYQTQIGPGISFGHGMGIVIARPAKIGARCKIRHQVTTANSGEGAAIIGDDVKIGAGAKILGNVRIGNRSLVGANAVVVHDVPDDAVVVGIPARVVRLNGQRIPAGGE